MTEGGVKHIETRRLGQAVGTNEKKSGVSNGWAPPATTPAQRLGVLFRSLRPAVSAFPERVVGSACALSFSRPARRSLALRPAHSRRHQFVTRYTKASATSLPP